MLFTNPLALQEARGSDAPRDHKRKRVAGDSATSEKRRRARREEDTTTHRILILRAYQPLEMINGPQELRTIIRDVVTGKRHNTTVA